MTFSLRFECSSDLGAIAEVVSAAFVGHPRSDGSEPRIVERLRALGHLTHSIVAQQEGQVVGHVAFSRVSLVPGGQGWYGLGPLSVHPRQQGRGVGSALVARGLEEIQASGAAGCVVFGSPAFYGRFGFRLSTLMRYGGGPATHFLIQAFNGLEPRATVHYSQAFGEA